jgi:hypothetical protein
MPPKTGISDAEADAMVEKLAADGIVVTRDQARDAVVKVAEILLLVMREQSLKKE